jgi:pseudouridine-5'-phosphate glycosidase
MIVTVTIACAALAGMDSMAAGGGGGVWEG